MRLACARSEPCVDERFRWANYAKCFPPDFEFTVTEKPRQYLNAVFLQDGLNPQPAFDSL